MDDQHSSRLSPSGQNYKDLAEAACASAEPISQCLELDTLVLNHDLPSKIPVSPAELDLLRIYFADLIEEAMKPLP